MRHDYFATFAGQEGELYLGKPERAPLLIRLGDKSIWQFDSQSWTEKEGYKVRYRPADIVEFTWVQPSTGKGL